MLANVAWEPLPRFRLGAQVQLATTESTSWVFDEEGGKETWKGGRWAAATRAGVSVELEPKRHMLALTREQGLPLASRQGPFPKLKTPHSLALAGWVGVPGSWEFEVNFVYGWMKCWVLQEAQARTDNFGLRSGMGIWLTPVIQLRAGGAVFAHSGPKQTAQPMGTWGGSLSAGALWRYGPMRAEMAWQMLADFESSNHSAYVQQRMSNLLSLGLGWNW
jgi:hypothetical protein